MKWFWYVAKPDELMVDLDGAILLAISQKRLERCGLPVLKTFISPSNSDDHFHLVVKLRYPMEVIERQIWQLYLMDHVYRSVNNLFRAHSGTKGASLLIAPIRWCCSGISQSDFWREPDGICTCKEKHSGPTFGGCKIGAKLRGNDDRRNEKLGTNK